MSEGKLHKVLKRKFARSTGHTEHLLPSGRKIDAVSPTGIFTEIELDGAPGRRAAVSRQKEVQTLSLARKVRVVVPPEKVDSTYDEMRRQRVRGEVLSTDGTARKYVPKRRKSTKY